MDGNGATKSLRAIFRSIPRSNLLYWGLASLISVIGALLTLPGVVYTEISSFELAMRTINVVAYAFTLSIPFLIGASVLLTTEDSHKSFVDLSMSGTTHRGMYTSCFILLLMLCSSFTVLLTVGSFILSQLASSLFMLQYILGTAIAAILMTVLLCPMGVLLAVVFDDWKTSTGFGCGLFLAVAFTTGMPSSPARYTELVFLGPAQYFRALAASLSGIEFPSALEMINHFGVYFTLESLIVPTIVIILLSVLSLWTSNRVFKQNIQVWCFDHDPWGSQHLDETQLTGQPPREMLERARTIKKKRKQLRRYAMAILVLGIFLIPTAGYGYTVYRETSDTTLLYQNQHSLPIGQWLYGEFSATRPQWPLSLMVRYEISVLDWNGCPDSLIRQHGCQMLTFEEFGTLNDTERWNAGYAMGSGLVNPETRDEGSYGVNLSNESSYMVWALRFVDSNWNITSGVLTFSISVYLQVFSPN